MVALVALGLVLVGAVVMQAQDSTPPADNPGKGKGKGGGGMRGAPIELTDAQKTALEKPTADFTKAVKDFQDVATKTLGDENQARRFVMQTVMTATGGMGGPGGKGKTKAAPDASAKPTGT
jgi:Spy/CpxP family protein refolding chaperone